MKRLIAAILVTTFAVIPVSAFAHSKSETRPADGETVSSVETISLEFDKPMRVTAFTVTSEDGEVATSSEQGTDMVGEYSATPGNALEPGQYTVEWRGLSEDGHPMQGDFRFTVSE